MEASLLSQVIKTPSKCKYSTRYISRTNCYARNHSRLRRGILKGKVTDIKREQAVSSLSVPMF